MKNAFFLLIVVLGGCATQNQLRLESIAKDTRFDDYFSSAAEVRTFDTLEQAEEYVAVAQIKLSSAIGKQSAKGLAARLTGPKPDRPEPVVVVHYFSASTTSLQINLTPSRESLQSKLQRAISVGSVFLVFYEDRAVSISDFYLASNYRYNNNSQPRTFWFLDHEYPASYPIGWGNDQAFGYLRKATDERQG